MNRWSEWMDAEEGGEDSEYSVHQVLSFLRGAYRDRDYEKAEKILIGREARIRAEMVEEVEKDGREKVREMEKKVEEEERLRKEVEKRLEVKVQVELRLRKEVEMLEVKCGEAVRLKEIAEERVKDLEKECEVLREGDVKWRDGEGPAGESHETLKPKVKEMEEDATKKVKDMWLKIEVEEGLRKKAEEELVVSEAKFKELEEKVLSLQKDLDLLRSLKTGAQGSKMKVENNYPAEVENEAEVQASVRVSSDQFGRGSVVPSVKTVEKTTTEGASPASGANMKQSVDREKQTIDDGTPRNKLGKPCAKHGLGSCIEINSSSDEDPSELQLRSKYKSDLDPIKLDFESNTPSESDHDSPEVSSGLKRKRMPSINEDKTESIQQLSTGEQTLPHLLIQEGKKVRPSNVSLTPPSGHSILKSGQQKDISKGPEITENFELWKKSFIESLRNKHWDDVSSDSSSEE